MDESYPLKGGSPFPCRDMRNGAERQRNVSGTWAECPRNEQVFLLKKQGGTPTERQRNAGGTRAEHQRNANGTTERANERPSERPTDRTTD